MPWKKTCAITNLPIFEDEEVFGVIIVQNHDFESHCYTDHLYSPMYFPFYGEYDEYGSVKNQHGIGINFMLECIRDKMIEMEQGENQTHDIPVKKENFDFSIMMDAIHEKRLLLEGYSGLCHYNLSGRKHNRVERVLMKKSAVDKLLNELTYEKYVGRTNPDNPYVNYGFKDLVNETSDFIQEYVDLHGEMKKRKENKEDTLDQEFFSRTLGLFDPDYMITKVYDKYTFLPSFLRTFTQHSISGFCPLTRVSNLVENDKIEEAHSILIDALKVAWINSFFGQTRRSWIPQCGEGGTEYDYDMYKFLANMTLEIIEKHEREYDEDY